MHIYNSKICNPHYCEDCKHINKEYSQFPCNKCVMNDAGENCYYDHCELNQNNRNDDSKIENILDLLNGLNEEKRMKIFSNFCQSCGSNLHYCQCKKR